MSTTHVMPLLEMRAFPEPDSSIVKKINDLLITLNQQTLCLPRKTMVLAMYDQDTFVGGICFRWYGASAMLDYMAVEENWRRQGIGKKLVAAAELEMQRQGCRQIIVDTMAYQAPAFYQRLGYEITATIPDYYATFDRIILRKHLPETMHT